MEQTIPRLVLAAADRFGDASALEDGDIQLSFRALADAGLEAARGFCAAGVTPGDRVAIWAPNIAEWVIAAIGAQSAGAVVAAISTRMKGTEAAQALRKSGAKWLLTMGGEFLGTSYVSMLEGEDVPDLEQIIVFRQETPNTTSWADFLAAGASVPLAEARSRAESVKPDDLSDLIFTSGTTGAPKAVACAHGQNIRAFESWSEVVGLREGDRYLIVMPFFHSMGYKAGWLAALMRGAAILPQAVFELDEVLARISRDKISMLPGAPSLYQNLLSHPERAKFDLSTLRLAVTGAAPVPVSLVHQMREDLGFETVITGYGLTEACGIATMCRFDDDPETISTTSGRAIRDVEVLCVDADGEEVARGEPGEVVVRGYNLMHGYFGDPEETAKAIDANGWLHTGDIAVMDERGYIRITDRLKDMYITNGFNCYPAEIENLMYGSDLVGQVAVIGIADTQAGEVGMAFVVPSPGNDVTPEDIVTWCRANMSNYKVPRRVVLVDELPTNASAKVDKVLLRERAASL